MLCTNRFVERFLWCYTPIDISEIAMSRRTGQLIALFSVIVLIVAVSGYQYLYGGALFKSDVLQSGYEGTAVVAPGVTVTPTSGLTTTESGGTAGFSVALDTVPAFDVTLTLSSGNPGEGTVSPTSLVFTPANAATPQSVTVTGVDDKTVDGNVAYSILTAALVSTDLSYNGLDPADVSVSNADNDTAEVPPVVTPPAEIPTAVTTPVETAPVVTNPVETSPVVTPPVVVAPVCGDNKVDPGEQCDDGNTNDGDACSSTCQTVVSAAPAIPELQANPPQSTHDENGTTVYQYLVKIGDRAVLDAVQYHDVTSSTARVRWASTNPSVVIDDPASARTFFIPAAEGEVSFTVEMRRADGSYQSLPVRFDFSMVSELAYSADANHDGIYDFNDLLALLQNWDAYGEKATTILSVILSRYQGE